MGVHRLSNGREIYLVRWKMVDTYSGFLERSAKVASQDIRENLSKMASEILPPGRPLAIVGPPQGNLPEWLSVVGLESRSGVQHTDPEFQSRLFVCWFMADTARSLDDTIDSILPEVDWEGIAQDYDIMDF